MPIALVLDWGDDMLFGLGGRETASHVVKKWYDQAQAASAKKEKGADEEHRLPSQKGSSLVRSLASARGEEEAECDAKVSRERS